LCLSLFGFKNSIGILILSVVLAKAIGGCDEIGAINEA